MTDEIQITLNQLEMERRHIRNTQARNVHDSVVAQVRRMLDDYAAAYGTGKTGGSGVGGGLGAGGGPGKKSGRPF